MANESDITITIAGKTHHFSQGDFEWFKSLPWSERKQLIELLENIKQAEYVKKPTESDDAVIKHQPDSKTINSEAGNHVSSRMPMGKHSSKVHDEAGFDSTVKKSDQDVDDLMQRLIIQEKQHHKPIPDKSAVMKLILGVFVVVFILAVVF